MAADVACEVEGLHRRLVVGLRHVRWQWWASGVVGHWGAAAADEVRVADVRGQRRRLSGAAAPLQCEWQMAAARRLCGLWQRLRRLM